MVSPRQNASEAINRSFSFVHWWEIIIHIYQFRSFPSEIMISWWISALWSFQNVEFVWLVAFESVECASSMRDFGSSPPKFIISTFWKCSSKYTQTYIESWSNLLHPNDSIMWPNIRCETCRTMPKWYYSDIDRRIYMMCQRWNSNPMHLQHGITEEYPQQQQRKTRLWKRRGNNNHR